MTDMEDTLNSLILELRRGTVVLAVMSQLTTPQYGYSMVSSLQEKGFSIDPGTLYPLLRRLEKQGLLDSKWDTDESRPRKYYILSKTGEMVYAQLQREWQKITDGLNALIQGASNDGTH